MNSDKNPSSEISRFLNANNLSLINNRPLEIIVLFLLLATALFFYLFFTLDNQPLIYLAYSIVSFLFVVLIIIKIRKEKRTTMMSQIEYHPTMKEVAKAVDDIFRESKNESQITQTYIGNNFLAGTQDILFKHVLVNEERMEKNPKILTRQLNR